MMKRTYGRSRTILAGQILSILITAAPVAASAQPAPTPSEQAGIVYYQVTFADGTVRDLNEIPKDKKGIRRVVRISRFEPDVKGYEIITTRHPMVKSVRPGRTVKHELTWNDKAWVGPERRQAK